ncbi:hypothetical protein GcC1_03643 [Golovinomyces cichoracearum]|uniref:Uncharacterized protein n=1 Tax=Golovinomyces cichoracearum TaxID=62708 RepID=A0A420ITX6_9PEZI|nr:hypothetical protein GcC1_03643 [Golovinomyces cichoracearum]
MTIEQLMAFFHNSEIIWFWIGSIFMIGTGVNPSSPSQISYRNITRSAPASIFTHTFTFFIAVGLKLAMYA